MSDALIDIKTGGPAMGFTLPTVNSADAAVGVKVPKAEAPAQALAAPDPDVVVLDPVPAVLPNHFLYDFYYRIWVVPELMNAQNPVIGQPIPFAIWNAYPQPPVNELASIVGDGATGLVFDFAPGTEWKAIEYKTVNITITEAAPINIEATFDFGFTFGAGRFFFNASIADFVQMVPDPPVVETWGWMTDVIPSRTNVEQRIALRSTPRRSVKYGFMLESEDERRRQYNRWFKSLGSRIILPYYQYATKLTQAGEPGDSKLFFDPARTDVRDGEFVIVLLEETATGFLVKLGTVEADGATTDTPLQFAATTRMLLAPAFMSRLADRTGLSMRSVTGHIDVDAQALTYRQSFKRPGSAAVIQTYEELPVLHLRPIAAGDTPEVFDANYEVVDSETGVEDIYVPWAHPDVGTSRKYTIRRRQNPAEMDWWRDFLDTVLGRREPFLQPTWFADLTLVGNPAPGAGIITITNEDYADRYFPFETFQRLQLETEAGLVWRRVVSATVNEDGTTDLQLDSALGGGAEDVAISKISFLNRVRLASDTVTLTHERLRTQIELTTKTVDL